MLKKLPILVVTFFTVASGSLADCIAVIPAGSGPVFWGEVIRGAEDAGADLGYSIYARGPRDEADQRAQLYAVDAALERGCEGLVLAPNSQDVVSRIGLLGASGLPTVFIDRDMGGARRSVVMTDNVEAGRLAGRRMAELLGHSGQVAVLRQEPGVASTDARARGFVEVMRDAGIEVVVDAYIGTSVGAGRANARAMLDGVAVDGIFTPNESTTVAVLLEREGAQRAGPVRHIGFDYTPLLEAAILSGELDGVVIQQPYQIGYQGVAALVRVLKDAPVDPEVNVDAFFVNRSTVADAGARPPSEEDPS